MNGYLADTFNLALTGFLILLNGFFVAAEFALVKVNKGKIKTMQKDKNPFATIASWLYKRQNMALSACQMGITMASLALGWIGEPALAHLIKPVLESIGIESIVVLHGVAFGIAFTIITSLHIVVGEQFPKIYAIRKPVAVLGWTSFILKFFYILLYPFMWLLDRITSWLLKLVGIESAGEHETVLTEEEIRASLSIAYNQGNMTKYEHLLLDAAFRFDEQFTRQIMLPRSEVIYFDLNKSYQENLDVAVKTKHTRFPLCKGSLDDIKGVVHIKDLLALLPLEDVSGLSKIARAPIFIPETLPVSTLLQEFRNSKQHFAFVEDEYGTVIGVVTLENVIELLVGNVQDEFDAEKPELVKENEGKYLIEGDLAINYINKYLEINLEAEDADTLSGLLVERAGLHLWKGQKIILNQGITAEIISVKNRRATKVRLYLPQDTSETE